jgi:hypothetical protein
MRYRSLAVIAAFAAMAVVSASMARADDGKDAFAKRIFAGKVAAKGKSYACFARRYDKAHLARHPQQKVTAMTLLVSAELLPEDKALNYAFAMGVKFNDRKGNFNSAGDCGHPTVTQESPDKIALGCGVDCDGGGLAAELVNNDKQLRVSIDSIAIWNSKSKGDVDDRDGFNGGADDHVFLLERTDLDACKSLMDGDDKPASM